MNMNSYILLNGYSFTLDAFSKSIFIISWKNKMILCHGGGGG